MIKKYLFAGAVLAAVLIYGVLSAKVGMNPPGPDDEVILMKKSASPVIVKTAVPEPSETATAAPEKKKETPVHAKPVKKEDAEAKQGAGEKETVKSIIDKVRASQDKRKAMITDIRIETKYNDVNALQVIRGKVIIKKQDKFYVKYTEPAEQEMVSDGKMLWVYTPMLEQVIKQDIKKANMNMQFYIEIENSIGFFAKYSKTKLSEEDGLYVITMDPDKSKIDYDSIIVKVDKKTLIPKQMSMTYDGTFVNVVFENTKVYSAAEAAKNDELKDSRFTFKVPEGVDVIDGAELLGQ